MDFVFWIILLVVIAAGVWWWLNRKNSSAASGSSDQAEATGPDAGTRPDGAARADGALAGGTAAASAEVAATTGMAGVAGFGTPAGPGAPATADEPVEATTTPGRASSAPQSHSRAGATAVGAGTGTGTAEGTPQDERRVQDAAEWETQWSEASGSAQAQATGQREGAAPESSSPGQAKPTRPAPVHHPEYTAAHAPTLPGAETAAVEDAGEADTPASLPAPPANASGPRDSGGHAAAAGSRVPANAAAAETRDRAQSSALVETGADHSQDRTGAAPAVPEPAGHLAAEEPYGAGSASAAADGSGPAEYTVKGDAAAMVYYEEGHPEYDQAKAEVWFESAAHAEAAGFRAPRRRRI